MFSLNLSLILLLSAALSPSLSYAESFHPTSPDIAVARAISEAEPSATPAEIASRILIGEEYKKLFVWMREDLSQYLENFDAIFNAKLERIRKHEQQRLADLSAHTAAIRKQITAGDTSQELANELARLQELHKPHAFVANYTDATDFTQQFVGPKGKLLKSTPSQVEANQMNLGGKKELYVDTWGVPFFNTGTQTRAEAKEGVKQALAVFKSIPIDADISMLKFTELMALFARPEFADVRRYKLLPFPTQQDLQRFGKERSDAKTFGDKYPNEAMVVINRPVDLGPVSFIFGQQVHIMGLLSHSLVESTADGRIFTGPADFLEHDWAHAYFNLSPNIPGTREEWEAVHREFISRRNQITDPKQKKMDRLVYYHFTHESGFRVLLPGASKASLAAAFENELNVIKELMQTRHHYDFMLKGDLYQDGYEPYLRTAFANTGRFFFDRFMTILDKHQKRCGELLDAVGQPLVKRELQYE